MIRRVTQPLDFSVGITDIGCIDCGGITKPIVMQEDQYWLTMEAEYGLPKPLLQDLMRQWEEQKVIRNFGKWLTWYAEQEEE
jgi:hypothetical protein